MKHVELLRISTTIHDPSVFLSLICSNTFALFLVAIASYVEQRLRTFQRVISKNRKMLRKMFRLIRAACLRSFVVRPHPNLLKSIFSYRNFILEFKVTLHTILYRNTLLDPVFTSCVYYTKKR